MQDASYKLQDIRLKIIVLVGRVGRVTLHHGNCQRTIDVKPSILRTRLVPSKFI